MKFIRVIVALCMISGFLLLGPAHAATTKITIKVVTTQGAPIASASYGFLPGCDEACGPYSTDASGLGELNLSDGDYTVVVSAGGYVATSVDFTVGPGAPTEVVVTMPVGGTIRVSGLPVPSPGKMIAGKVTPHPLVIPKGFFERFRLSAMRYKEVEPGIAEVSGLAAGDYRVLFFLEGLDGIDSFRRAWYGGGVLMSSGQPIRVELGQTTSIAAGDMPVHRSLPALPPPEIAADPQGFTVTLRDPEGLGIGLNYDLEYRNATSGNGEWSSYWGLFADVPWRMKLGEQVVGVPGDRFEFRVRVWGKGAWSEIVDSGAGRSGRAPSVGGSAYEINGQWSAPRVARLLPAKPTRPPKPAVWMKGKKRILVWGPVLGATRYEAQGKRGTGKWAPIKPRWTKKTQRALTKLKAGSWRFQVRANNLGGNSGWSQASKPVKVG